MTEHELKFPGSDAGDKAAEAKVRQLLADPDAFGVSHHTGSEGSVVKYTTRD